MLFLLQFTHPTLGDTLLCRVPGFCPQEPPTGGRIYTNTLTAWQKVDKQGMKPAPTGLSLCVPVHHLGGFPATEQGLGE